MAYRVERPTVIGDDLGRTGFVSVFGDITTGRRNAVLSETFHHGALNTISLNAAVTANGGAVTVTNGLLTVGAGTSATGSASISTRRRNRYRPGYGCEFLFTAMFTTGAAAADADQWVGPLDDNNGFAVGVRNGTFTVLWRRAGQDTYVTAANMDIPITQAGNISGFTLDPTKLNIFRIDFGYLGIAPPTFWVQGGAGLGWIPFHVIPMVNLYTQTHLSNPNLPISVYSVKRSGSQTVEVKSGSWYGGMTGSDNPFVGSRHGAVQSGTVALAANTTKLLALFKNATTYGGNTNTVGVFIRQLNAATDGTRSVQVRALLNPTITGTPSYTAYDATNSVVTYDTTLTGVSITGGRLVGALNIEKSGGGEIEFPENEVDMQPGDVIAITALSAANNDISWQAEWDEQF